MKRHKMTVLPVGLLLIGLLSASTSYAQKTVSSPTAIHEQTAKHSQDVVKALATIATPETAYDFIHFGLSGPVVILEGFTINDVLKKDAEASVKNVEWVTHVVNEIEYLQMGPEVRRLRRQTLAKLEELVPQAFPENQANIRIKVTPKGDITLVGVISKVDKVRFEAAVEQIKHIELVGTVTSHVVESTS